MNEEIKNRVEGAWMLQKELLSPWKSVIVPVFLDFNVKTNIAMIRGYNDNSVSNLTYYEKDGYLKIGDKFVAEILNISDEKLIIKIDKNEYKYYKLLDNPFLLNKNGLQKDLIKSKWLINNDIYEFKDEIVNANGGFKIIKYQGNKKYFGTYTFDEFNNNLFLILLIDGNYMEMVFKVINNDNSVVKLQTASGNIFKLIQQVGNHN